MELQVNNIGMKTVICLWGLFAGCAPLTTFYVKNNSEQTMNFKISITTYRNMTGQLNATLPFILGAQDSVLVRRLYYGRTELPNQWFTKFAIFPVDGVPANDPRLAENWLKTQDGRGRPVYTFNITK